MRSILRDEPDSRGAAESAAGGRVPSRTEAQNWSVWQEWRYPEHFIDIRRRVHHVWTHAGAFYDPRCKVTEILVCLGTVHIRNSSGQLGYHLIAGDIGSR